MNSSKIALSAARKSVKAAGGQRKVRIPRIIPISKTGGILPLISVFARLSVLDSLASGEAGIVRAVKSAKKSSEDKTAVGLYLKSN